MHHVVVGVVLFLCWDRSRQDACDPISRELRLALSPTHSSRAWTPCLPCSPGETRALCLGDLLLIGGPYLETARFRELSGNTAGSLAPPPRSGSYQVDVGCLPACYHTHGVPLELTIRGRLARVLSDVRNDVTIRASPVSCQPLLLCRAQRRILI